MLFLKKCTLFFIFVLFILTCTQAIYAVDNETQIENTDSINEQVCLTEDNTISDDVNSLDEDNDKDELNVDKLADSHEKINITIEPIKVTSTYQIGNYTFKITDSQTGDLIVNKSIKFKVRIYGKVVQYDKEQTTKTDENGVATFFLNKINDTLNPNNHNLNVGTHNLTITGLDDLNGKLVTPITVEKIDATVTVEPYSEENGSSKKVIIKVTSKQTGEGISDAKLFIEIPDSVEKNFTVPASEKGIVEVNVTSLGIGTHAINVTTIDSNINPTNTSSTITINKVKLNIKLASIIEYYNSGNTAVLYITNQQGRPMANVNVKVKVDGTTYNAKTLKEGKITVKTPLKTGSHELEVLINSNLYSGQLTKKFTVKKAKGNVKISTKTVYYKSGKLLKVKLINSITKQSIYNSKIKVLFKKSNKVIYKLDTQTNGKGIHLFNILLKPGKYRIIVTGKDSGNVDVKKLSEKFTVKKNPLSLSLKKSSKKIKIKAVSKKTKKAAGDVKLKIKVKSGKKIKTYNKVTNSKGCVSIKMKSGTYQVTANVMDDGYIVKSLKKNVKI